MITYTHLHTEDELNQVVALQAAVWGMSLEHTVPAHSLRIATYCGIPIIGAKDGDRVVAFGYGFAARRFDQWVLWSDMVGVHPEYQSQGIGMQLKLEQRAWALANGFNIICWTFDPMQRRNAHFNLRRLGAFSNTYHVNFYGFMDDSINGGLPTDRLEITWRLDDPRVKAVAVGKTLPPDETVGTFLLRLEPGNLLCERQPAAWDARCYFVEIPYTLRALKAESMEQAQSWQKMLRGLLREAFNAGYAVVDVGCTADRCWYILKPVE